MYETRAIRNPQPATRNPQSAGLPHLTTVPLPFQSCVKQRGLDRADVAATGVYGAVRAKPISGKPPERWGPWPKSTSLRHRRRSKGQGDMRAGTYKSGTSSVMRVPWAMRSLHNDGSPLCRQARPCQTSDVRRLSTSRSRDGRVCTCGQLENLHGRRCLRAHEGWRNMQPDTTQRYTVQAHASFSRHARAMVIRV